MANRRSNVIHAWLLESGYTVVTISKLLHINFKLVAIVMRSPELYLTIDDLGQIALACDRSLSEVICAVIADEVQAGRFLSWYED